MSSGGTTGGGPSGVAPTLAERLQRLFDLVHPPDRGPYTLDEVATAIRAGGTPITAQYIWLLRRGERDNPTRKHLAALAAFFHVPAAYFFDDEGVVDEVDAQLGLLAAMRDRGVRTVAMRAAGLSSTSLGAIQSMIEHTRRLEGLPSTPLRLDGADEVGEG